MCCAQADSWILGSSDIEWSISGHDQRFTQKTQMDTWKSVRFRRSHRFSTNLRITFATSHLCADASLLGELRRIYFSADTNPQSCSHPHLLLKDRGKPCSNNPTTSNFQRATRNSWAIKSWDTSIPTPSSKRVHVGWIGWIGWIGWTLQKFGSAHAPKCYATLCSRFRAHPVESTRLSTSISNHLHRDFPQSWGFP